VSTFLYHNSNVIFWYLLHELLAFFEQAGSPTSWLLSFILVLSCRECAADRVASWQEDNTCTTMKKVMRRMDALEAHRTRSAQDARTHHRALATRHHAGPNTMHAAATTRSVCSAMAPTPQSNTSVSIARTRHHHARNSVNHTWLCQGYLSKYLHFPPIAMLTARPVWLFGRPCMLCKWSPLWETLLISVWLQHHHCHSGPHRSPGKTFPEAPHHDLRHHTTLPCAFLVQSFLLLSSPLCKVCLAKLCKYLQRFLTCSLHAAVQSHFLLMAYTCNFAWLEQCPSGNPLAGIRQGEPIMPMVANNILWSGACIAMTLAHLFPRLPLTHGEWRV